MKKNFPIRQQKSDRFQAVIKALSVTLWLLIFLGASPAMTQSLATELGQAAGVDQALSEGAPAPDAQPAGEKAINKGNCGGLAAGQCQGQPTEIYGAWIRFDNGQASFFARPELVEDMRELGCTVTMLKTEASKPEAADRWIDMLLYAETFGVKVRISYGPEASNPQTCYIKHIYLFHS